MLFEINSLLRTYWKVLIEPSNIIILSIYAIRGLLYEYEAKAIICFSYFDNYYYNVNYIYICVYIYYFIEFYCLSYILCSLFCSMQSPTFQNVRPLGSDHSQKNKKSLWWNLIATSNEPWNQCFGPQIVACNMLFSLSIYILCSDMFI